MFCVLLLVFLYVGCCGSVASIGVCLLSFACIYVVSARQGSLFLLVFGTGCIFNCVTPRALHISFMQTNCWYCHRYKLCFTCSRVYFYFMKSLSGDNQTNII